MKNNYFTFSTLQLFVVILLIQLILTPVIVLGQDERGDPTDAAEKKRRLDQAAILKAESEARKAKADADKVESDIAKQNLEMRKTQLDLLKSTSTVEGNLVENNIAASKAIGCAAADIAIDLETITGVPKFKYLLLYSPEAATSLSEYTAIRSQINSTEDAYRKVRPKLEQKLSATVVDEVNALTARIEDLGNDILRLEAEITNLRRPNLNAQERTRFAALNAELTDTRRALIASQEAVGALGGGNIERIAPALSALSLGGPAGMAVSAALDMLALFKTDTSLKGTDIKPGVQELNGYLFRVLNLKLTTAATHGSRNQPSSAAIFKVGDRQMISPDNIVLSDIKASGTELIGLMRALNTEYVLGKKLSAKVGVTRKAIVERAERDLNKKNLTTEVKLGEVIVDQKLKAYAATPTELAKYEYQLALAELNRRTANLDKAQKEIDRRAGAFDENIGNENAELEALHVISETLSKRLIGPADKDTATQRSLGDYLRAEVLYRKIQDGKALWLETNISANGANQMKKSSPIIDIFTRGPMLSYSGGAVVSYQMREMDGTIVLAGTTWTYAPYRKSSNITKFECRSTRQQGIQELPFRNW